MCIVKKIIFIVHSKKSNNHENENETMKLKLLCLMQASYIQYPSF